MKKIVPVLLLFITPLVMCAEKYEQTLDSGHIGAVISLAWDEGGNLLFSGGRDGTLRIWRTEPLRLLRKIQISDLPVRKIKLNPKKNDIAIVQTDGISRHELSVWNWETGKRKFSASLSEVPLILEFSPLGNFVVVSKTDWKSLTFFDASSGKILPYLRDGFGIVSFLMVSASENTLLSYTPSSGSFIYWELKPGTVKQTVRSVPELKNLTLFTARYALGTMGQDFVAVDLVTGSVAASIHEEGILKIVVNPRGGISTLGTRDGAWYMQTWDFLPPDSFSSRGLLIKTGDMNRRVPPDVADSLYAGDRLFLALADGAIGSVMGPYQPLEHLGKNRISAVTDILAGEGYMHAVTANRIFTFSSDLFSRSLSRLSQATFLKMDIKYNPLETSSGIIEDGAGNVYFWNKDPNSPGKIARIDLSTGSVISRFDAFSLPLSTVREADNFIFSLEKNGSLRKINAGTMLQEYEYPAWGLHTMEPLDNRVFLAGKNSSGTFMSPLISIDTFTGETVSLSIPRVFLVFHIKYDPVRGRLHFLGLEETGPNKTGTKLFSADLSRPESAVAVGSYESVDIDAEIYIDRETAHLYTTLGNSRIRSWDGSRWKDFEPYNGLTSTLHDYGDILFGINSEGSVSLWEKKSGKLLGTIYILSDGNWLVLTAEGYVLSSHQNTQDIPLTTLKNGSELPAEKLEDLRLTIDG